MCLFHVSCCAGGTGGGGGGVATTKNLKNLWIIRTHFSLNEHFASSVFPNAVPNRNAWEFKKHTQKQQNLGNGEDEEKREFSRAVIEANQVTPGRKSIQATEL